MHRFRFLGEQEKAGLWRLSDEEAHHLAKVLRLKVGDSVEVGDGAGQWAVGEISEISNKTVSIKALESFEVMERPDKLHVAVGFLESANMSDVIAALSELGVDHLHVFMQKHTAKARLSDTVLARWQKSALQSMKQSKRAWAMQVNGHKSLSEVITRVELGANKFFFDETRTDLKEKSGLQDFVPGEAALAILGSEAGFGDDERQLLMSKNFSVVNLGETVLRAVTACTVVGFLMSGLRQKLFKI